MAKEKIKSLIPIEPIARQIYLIRSQKVMLDADLAGLYAVQTKVFNRLSGGMAGVFLKTSCFQLTQEGSRSKVTTCDLRKETRPVAEIRPLAFTEQGGSDALLNSAQQAGRSGKRRHDANVRKLREMFPTNEEQARRWCIMTGKIAVLFDHVQKMLAPGAGEEESIGYIHPRTEAAMFHKRPFVQRGAGLARRPFCPGPMLAVRILFAR